jgi:hypothetical protein
VERVGALKIVKQLKAERREVQRKGALRQQQEGDVRLNVFSGRVDLAARVRGKGSWFEGRRPPHLPREPRQVALSHTALRPLSAVQRCKSYES